MNDPVELKISLSGNVDALLSRFDLRHGRQRDVYFLEDLVNRSSEQPVLLTAGIILRLRSNADESTVKLRPCRRNQLVDQWTRSHPKDRDDFEYKIERDWAGDRHVLAASAVAQPKMGTVDRVTKGVDDVSKAFCRQQIRYLEECADIPIHLDRLTSLGPILATKWSWSGLAATVVGDVNVERWQADDMDFIELSARVDAGVDPKPAQRRFDSELRTMGLPIDRMQETKTKAVIEKLIYTHH
jgi:hypothetical protein